MRRIWQVMAVQSGMGRAAFLAALVLVAGWGLLALSGWFITAAAIAGLAGMGLAFDVFMPGAGVRGLAILRTLARYGERWFGHNATLHGVAGLRRAVLAGLAGLAWRRLAQLRRGPAISRVIADTDALDGLPLRLVLPAIAALATFIIAGAGLWYLADARMAALICGAHLAAALIAGLWGFARARRLAAATAIAEQRFHGATLDLIAARDDLAVHGRLIHARARALRFDDEARALAVRLDGVGRDVGLILELGRGGAMAGALALGTQAVGAGVYGPAIAALGFFSAMALAEAIAPLRRAVVDYGRIADAASRVAPVLGEPAPEADSDLRAPHLGAVTLSKLEPAAPAKGTAPDFSPDPALAADDPLPVQIGATTLRAGETLLLTGPSGAGKTTLLAAVAGLSPDPRPITLNGRAPRDWDEARLRRVLALVPQRPALINGTLRDNLRLADPLARDDVMQAALRVVRLDHLRDGLDLTLRDGGEGLSGGERRRLAIARALLRRPRVMLLDEPTEGLDHETARTVIANLRAALPGCAFIIATHRRTDLSEG